MQEEAAYSVLVETAALLVASAALAFAAMVVAPRLRSPSDSPFERALTGALLFLACLLGLSVVVGALGWYRPLPLTVGAVALALVARVTTRRRLFAGPGRPGTLARSTVAAARRSPLAAAVAALAVAAVLHRIVLAILLPPGGFDSLAYHLIFVGDWVRRGAIGTSELQQGGCCAWYPANTELVYGWLAVFSHSDRLVGLGQLAFLVLGGIASASITRAIGAATEHAVTAGSLFVLTPVALQQANVAQADVAMAAGVLMCVAFALRLVYAGAAATWRDVCRFALAAGVAVGIKTNAIPYVIAACVVVAASVLLTGRSAVEGPRRAKFVGAAALVAVFLAVGSGWYIRSWVVTGNPFWPFRLQAAGQVWFAGPKIPNELNQTPAALVGLPGPLQPMRSWLEELDVRDRMDRDPHDRDAKLGGLGPVWLGVGIPATLAALVVSLRRRDPRVAVLVLAVGVPALTTPDAWWSRYTIPIVVIGLAGLAYVAGALPRTAARALTAGALALAILGVIETRPLGPFDDIAATSGVPIERPPPSPDGLDYTAISHLPARDVRVGVAPGSPLLPYLSMGSAFERTVVRLDRRPRSAGELARTSEMERLDFMVTRHPLDPAVVVPAEYELVAKTSGAVVYRNGGS